MAAFKNHSGGYGQLGAALLAHRVSACLTYGHPTGLAVCHRCDNPPCWNPAHLFVGTQADNIRDAYTKGRMRFPTPRIGVEHEKCKLTEADVYAIRRLADQGNMRQADIGEMFGVSQAKVSQIKRRVAWSHLPEGKSMVVL
jgi:predicted DNA-binding protein (UPF0251 family)